MIVRAASDSSSVTTFGDADPSVDFTLDGIVDELAIEST
jgi:hypothetical protein